MWWAAVAVLWWTRSGRRKGAATAIVLLLNCSHKLTPFQCDVMSLPSLRVSLSLAYIQSEASPLHILSLTCAPFVSVLPV
jgi:hypothetical protein